MKNHRNLAQYDTLVSPQQTNALGGDAQNQCHTLAQETLEMVPIFLPLEGQIIRGVPVGRLNAHVFAGHGREPNLEFIVPEGTYLLLPDLVREQDRMKDRDGYYMEINGEAPIHIRMREYGPGATAPNLILSPGPDLKIAETSTTVTAPTYLSDLVRPYMGVCLWAACRVKDEPDAFDSTFKCAA